MENRACLKCKGTGKRAAFDVFPETECYSCDGKGIFKEPDYEAIKSACKGRKGLKSTRPKDERSYYVWRMARFHGGKDTTMPIMASVGVGGDPFVGELDKLADELAKQYFGTDIAAALRWKGLLY